MNPDLYAALPPDKKEEYKKLFREPNIDPIIQPTVDIDNSIPEGYALFGNKLFALPDAQTCTSEECKPLDIEELKSLFNTWDKLEADIVNGNYCLKLREETCKESMIKKIKEDMELRLKDVDKREIAQLWWKLYKYQRIS